MMDLQVLNSEILESPVLLSLASHIAIPQAPQGDGSILMSGTAPAADAAENIYFILGNGTFDTSAQVDSYCS